MADHLFETNIGQDDPTCVQKSSKSIGGTGRMQAKKQMIKSKASTTATYINTTTTTTIQTPLAENITPQSPAENPTNTKTPPAERNKTTMRGKCPTCQAQQAPMASQHTSRGPHLPLCTCCAASSKPTTQKVRDRSDHACHTKDTSTSKDGSND